MLEYMESSLLAYNNILTEWTDESFALGYQSHTRVISFGTYVASSYVAFFIKITLLCLWVALCGFNVQTVDFVYL